MRARGYRRSSSSRTTSCASCGFLGALLEKLREDITGTPENHLVRDRTELGPFQVDFHDVRARALGSPGEGSGGKDDCGCSNREKEHRALGRLDPLIPLIG